MSPGDLTWQHLENVLNRSMLDQTEGGDDESGTEDDGGFIVVATGSQLWVSAVESLVAVLAQ